MKCPQVCDTLLGLKPNSFCKEVDPYSDTRNCGTYPQPVGGAMAPTTWRLPNSPRYLARIFAAPTPSRCPCQRHAWLVQCNTRPAGALVRRCPHTGQARSVALLLKHDAHPQTLCFVGELVPNAAKGPLMEFLIDLGAFIQTVPDRAHIANDQLLDALSVQRVDQ